MMTEDNDEAFLSISEQAKLQEILAENDGKLFPDDLEVQDTALFQAFLKKALAKAKEKTRAILAFIALGITQKAISEQGRAEFIKKYAIAQAKLSRNQTQGTEQERGL
jgi:hypothetical protein